MNIQISLQALIDRAKNHLLAETGQSTPAINALASAIAGVSYGQYGYQDLLFRQMHPETCSEEWLYLHANRHSTPRLLPTFATGLVKFKELDGTVLINKGTRLSSSGFEYETLKAQYSSEPVAVIALTSGAESNLPKGAVLTLNEGLGGIDPNNVECLGIEGGADLEALEHWRARVVVAFEKNQLIGKSEDYEQWAVSAHSDVDFAWSLDNTPERGMVEVYIGTRHNDPAVSDEIIRLVQKTFEEKRLAGCHPRAKLPTQMKMNAEIQGVESPSIRKDVVTALESLVKDKMGKINPTTKKPESITNTEIVLAVSAVTNNFIVRAPTGEVTIEKNEIHILGEVTWTPPI
ncbi:baseplate J/gp47 family protein [Vibrio splendidus]|uniref:baseplate J/gp47 family protein n=1 Tax=Vibrio splendidus TaxID=29497 RepID=UPI00352E9C69